MEPPVRRHEPHANVDVSIVVPTRNRSAEAFAKAQWALAQPSCAEAIFVVDAAEDDTVDRLLALAANDTRLDVHVLREQRGAGTARNIGIRAARADWVLLLDDDDQLSEGFLEALLAVAADSGASIVGTPWFNLIGRERAAFISSAERRRGGPALDLPGIFPDKDWDDCLWFGTNMLVRRSVFSEVYFDSGYRGNHYREETDFLVSAARKGHRIVVTSLAYTYLERRVGGGIERKRRLAYEYWALRNNWRFLRKHGDWLRSAGHIRSMLGEQATFASRRATPLIRAALRRITGRLARAGAR